MKNMKLTKTLILTLALAMSIMASGCSAASPKSADVGVRVAEHNSEINAVVTEVNTATEAYEAEDFGYYEYSDEAVSGTSSTGSTSGTEYERNSQMLIRTISMNLETSNFVSVDSAIKTKVTELGGYIESSNVSGTGNDRDLRHGYYVVRIPSELMDAMITSVSNNAVVVASSETTDDVTLQYSDIQSHIEALRAEQSTLLNLLENTDSLDNIITLQSRLTEISYEIESYESAGRIMMNQATYSTLTLNVDEVLIEVEPEKPELPEEEPTWGESISRNFKDAWKDIKEDFKYNTIELAGIIPYLLIALGVFIVIALIIILIVVLVKKALKKNAKKTKKAVKTNNTETIKDESKT